MLAQSAGIKGMGMVDTVIDHHFFRLRSTESQSFKVIAETSNGGGGWFIPSLAFIHLPSHTAAGSGLASALIMTVTSLSLFSVLPLTQARVYLNV